MISVVIPFYKNKIWLAEALESVLSQSFKGFEIIVVNDGSPEDISDLEKLYTGVRFLKIENSGPGRARNLGIDIASYKYIAFLDADDLWYPEKLETQINFMETTGCKWSHTSYQKIWSEGDKTQLVNCKMEGKIIPEMFIYCPIATPCVMISRSILIDHPELRFAEDIRAGEDSYFWFKIAELFPLGFVDGYLTKVRIRGSNAALQAYLQLGSKSEKYEFISQSRKHFKNAVSFSLVKFGFLMCRLGYKTVSFLTKTLHLKSSLREILSKFIYAFPYLYLKSIKIIIR